MHPFYSKKVSSEISSGVDGSGKLGKPILGETLNMDKEAIAPVT
jgi:hypothetical protein